MSDEATFLLALARGDSGGADDRELDVERLRVLAATHQVEALCSLHLESGSDPTPSSAAMRKAFRLAYLHHTLRNEILVRDLTEVSEALARRGIGYLVFKGPWLALAAWPDPGTRPVDDIDLGVRERDFRGAVEALRELGYDAHDALPENPRDALRRAHYGRQLRFSATGRRPVELHFRMINVGPPAHDESWVWDGARELPLGSTRLPVPGREAMVLHVLLHANQHAFTILRLLYDVRFALEATGAELDVGSVLERARALRCSASIYHGLALAAELTGARPPGAMVEGVRPGPLRRAVFERIWRLPRVRRLESSKRATSIESPILYLLEMGSARDKARYLSAIVRQAGGPGDFLRSVLAAVSEKRGTPTT